MAIVDWYVDPDVVGGLGDGTSWANAYSSLNAFEAAKQTNLVTADNSYVVHCRSSAGTADTTACTFNGWTKNSTHTITIQSDIGDRHSGVYTTAKYRMNVANASCLTVNDTHGFITIDSLQFGLTGLTGATGTVTLFAGNSSWIVFKNNIIKGINNAQQQLGVNFNSANLTYYGYNNVIYNITGNTNSRGYYILNCTAANISSCTIYNCVTGIWTDGGTTVIKNNVHSSNSRYDFNKNGGNLTCTNCMSTDLTADDNGGSGNIVSTTPSYVDAANGNFNLKATDAICWKSGLDLRSDATMAVTTDIIGGNRPGVNNSIGAFLQYANNNRIKSMGSKLAIKRHHRICKKGWCI